MKIIKAMQKQLNFNANITPHEGGCTQLSSSSEFIGNRFFGAVKLFNKSIYFHGATSIFNLIVSIFLLAMMLLGDCQLSVQLISFCTFACVVLTKAGELSLRLFHLTSLKARLPAAFVVGFAVISLPMVVLTLNLNISALMALLLCSLAVMGSFICIVRTAIAVRPSNDWSDTFAVSVIIITIGLLAKIPLSSNANLLKLGVFPIWSDYFIHGITIASFGSPFATGGDMEIAGVSRIFYHYAPFIIPAAFQTVSGMSGLALSTSLLLPLGLLIAAFGIYTFAIELGGRVGGLVTLTVIICIPAYSALIQSGWFDFYWLLLIAPGSGYAIGVSAVVCASTVAYLDKRDVRILWFSILLLGSLVFIRVHMFLLLAPAIITVVLLQRYRANTKIIFGVVVGVITIGFLILYFSESVYSMWIKYSAPHVYLNIATSNFSIYGNFLTIPTDLPFGLTMLTQVMVILIAVLGIYIALYPPLLWINVRRNGFKETDAIPLFLVLFFIGLMLFSPIAENGDSSEYKHRHFLLLYVLFSIYTINYGIRFVINREFFTNNLKCMGYGFILLLISVTIFTSWGANPARPDIEKMPWTGKFHNQHISPGLLEITQYLRTNAKEGDVLAMGLSSVSSIGPSTQIVQIVSLTDIPAFIARSDLKMRGSQCVQAIVKKRLSILKELSLMDEWSVARSFLQTNRIRWYISTMGENPKWDISLKDVVFSSNGISVYDAGISSNKIFKENKC